MKTISSLEAKASTWVHCNYNRILQRRQFQQCILLASSIVRNQRFEKLFYLSFTTFSLKVFYFHSSDWKKITKKRKCKKYTQNFKTLNCIQLIQFGCFLWSEVLGRLDAKHSRNKNFLSRKLNFGAMCNCKKKRDNESC